MRPLSLVSSSVLFFFPPLTADTYFPNIDMPLAAIDARTIAAPIHYAAHPAGVASCPSAGAS